MPWPSSYRHFLPKGLCPGRLLCWRQLPQSTLFPRHPPASSLRLNITISVKRTLSTSFKTASCPPTPCFLLLTAYPAVFFLLALIAMWCTINLFTTLIIYCLSLIHSLQYKSPKCKHLCLFVSFTHPMFSRMNKGMLFLARYFWQWCFQG